MKYCLVITFTNHLEAAVLFIVYWLLHALM